MLFSSKFFKLLKIYYPYYRTTTTHEPLVIMPLRKKEKKKSFIEFWKDELILKETTAKSK